VHSSGSRRRRRSDSPRNDADDQSVTSVRTVLYVEDEAPLRGLVEFWLEDAGYRVLLAADGAEGLELVRAERPDLVITDAMMPNLSGDDLVEIMKSDPELRGIPIVMATAAASPLRIERMLERGCHAVLGKPLEEASFLAAASAALESAG
jgi:two-component system chemotaxis response regulator CheY